MSLDVKHSRQPRRAPVVGLVAALGIVLGWWVLWLAEPDAQPVPAPPPLLGSGAPSRPVVAPMSRSPAVPALVAQASAVERVPSGAPVWDLCGLARLPVPADAPASAPPELALMALPPHLGREAFEQARQSLLAALGAGPPRWRAAAIMLTGEDRAGRPQEEALPQLAQVSGDPVIAMWTLQRCPRPKACAQVDVERWAKLEPDNGAAWAYVLQNAPAHEHEAILAQMAQATRYDWYETALSAAVMEATPAHVPAYLLPALWMEVRGVEAAMSWPSPKPYFAYCRAALPREGEAFRRCAAIGRVMIERSDAILSVALGLRLAERTYLTKAEARSQLDVLYSLEPPLVFDTQQPLSCEGVQRIRQWVQLRIQGGGVGAWKAFVAERSASVAGPAR